MSKSKRPWEHVSASEGGAWYEGQPFDIGERVTIEDSALRIKLGADAGRVVGYDASGPRPGEDFYRVLVVPDRSDATIVALPPASLCLEEQNDRRGLALSTLLGLKQALGEERYARFEEWLLSPACAEILTDPRLSLRRIRAGGLAIPGMLLGEMVELARSNAT